MQLSNLHAGLVAASFIQALTNYLIVTKVISRWRKCKPSVNRIARAFKLAWLTLTMRTNLHLSRTSSIYLKSQFTLFRMQIQHRNVLSEGDHETLKAAATLARTRDGRRHVIFVLRVGRRTLADYAYCQNTMLEGVVGT